MNSQDDATLRRWKALVGDTSSESWDTENMAGFFQNFRPDGAGLRDVFEGVEAADEILPRLLEVYRATAIGWQGDGWCDGYFVVRNPPPLADSGAANLVRLHLERVAAMAGAVGHGELTAIAGGDLHYEVVGSEAPGDPDRDGRDTLIYEAIGDFIGSLAPRKSDALLMKEGLYTIACDANIQYHILWPLYRHASGIEEPFRPYFNLWKHGVSFRFSGKDTVRVYVP
jgi:hypothetical protein